MNQTTYVTLREAAAILGVSPRTVSRYAQKGLLTRVWRGGPPQEPRYSVKEVETFSAPRMRGKGSKARKG